MNPENFSRVLEVFAQAKECPTQERKAFLAQACPDDEAVRREVASLLEAHGAASDFLAAPAFQDGLELLNSVAAGGELRPGDELGDCRIISLLGEGGMGEVYLAQDTRLERQVAVKLLKRRLDDASLARRFRHERRVLAALTHPNIARLYGGGTTDEGRSYLVMEYVDGERLDRFCDRQGFSVAERLILFRKVCAAVAYAHQNLVVHRDLKPANIRVTSEGEPKLLDFGIAKLLDPEGDAAGTHSAPTATLPGAMTPEYASPEQLRGEAITTVSDVYSLGVVLYELLTGQRPHTAKSRRPDELAWAICEQDPPRPSTVAGRILSTTTGVPAGQVPTIREAPTRLRRLLEGDLDNIVAKALRKESTRRYPSVLAFSEDVRRHCEGLPVSARRDTLAYRTGKFVRRNKTLVVAGAMVALALVGGLVATTLEARRADRRFEDVRRLAYSILFEIEPNIANVPGTMSARGILVKRALEYLDSLSREAGSRRDLRRELVTAYEKVGAVQGEPNQPNLGDSLGALSSYRKARALRQALLADDPHDPQARHELATCDEHISQILWWSNQTAAAEQSLLAALAVRRRLVIEQPNSVEYRRGLASVLFRLGSIPAWNHKSAEAMTLFQQALSILQTLTQERPQDTEIQLDLARCLGDTADLQNDVGDHAGASKNLTSAEGIVTALAHREPNNFTARNLLRYDLYTEVGILLAQGLVEQALEVCPRMLNVAESLAKSDPENATSQFNLSASYDANGQALARTKRWPEALASFQAALAIATRLAADSSANVDYQRVCGTYRVQIGRVRVQLGEIALAEKDAQDAQDLLESAVRLSPDDPTAFQNLVQAYDFRGDLCELRSEDEQARQWFQRALEAIRSHAAVNIAANEAKAWDALREKFIAKTVSEITRSPPH